MRHFFPLQNVYDQQGPQENVQTSQDSLLLLITKMIFCTRSLPYQFLLSEITA